MKGNGKRIDLMVKVLSLNLMGLHTKVNSKMVIKMDKVSIDLEIKVFILGNGRKINEMEKEDKSGSMEKFTKDNGMMIIWKVKESSNGQMGGFMKVVG